MNRVRITLITFTAAALGLCSGAAQATVVPSNDVVAPGQAAPAHERMAPGAAGRDESPPTERGMQHGRAAQRFAHAHLKLFQRWMQHQRGQPSGRFHGQLERSGRPGEMGQRGPAGPQRDWRLGPGQPLPREQMRGQMRERIRERVRAMPSEQRDRLRDQIKQRWHGRQHEIMHNQDKGRAAIVISDMLACGRGRHRVFAQVQHPHQRQMARGRRRPGDASAAWFREQIPRAGRQPRSRGR